MKILSFLSLLTIAILAGCQREPIDITTEAPIDDIPNRPGVIEKVTGKKLEIGLF